MHLPFNAAPLPQPGPQDFLAEAERLLRERERHTAVLWNQEGFGQLLGGSVMSGEYQSAVAALHNPAFDTYDLRLFNADDFAMTHRVTVSDEGGMITDYNRAPTRMAGDDYAAAIGLFMAIKFVKPFTNVAAYCVCRQGAGSNWSFMPKDSLGRAARKVVREYSGRLVDELMLGMRSMWRLPPDLRR